MSFAYEEKESTSRFVDAIWKSYDQTNDTYIAPADGRWDIIFTTRYGRTKVILSSPTSQPTKVTYQAGNSNLGIRFHPSTFMSHVSTPDVINTLYNIQAINGTFRLFNRTWQLPTYDAAEAFIEKLEEAKLLGQDPIVRQVLDGVSSVITKRSVQRRFKKSTGFSEQYHGTIKQAEQAIRLLETSAMTIVEIAHFTGYADQAHMTRSLKRFTGLTPTEIIRSDNI